MPAGGGWLLSGVRPQGAVDGEDDDEELGDEAMMALDQNLASLFAEQKPRIQARKEKLQKEKVLRRDFQIRVSARTTGTAVGLPPPLRTPRTH